MDFCYYSIFPMHKKNVYIPVFCCFIRLSVVYLCGGDRIRTCGPFYRTHPFQGCALDHSATPPIFLCGGRGIRSPLWIFLQAKLLKNLKASTPSFRTTYIIRKNKVMHSSKYSLYISYFYAVGEGFEPSKGFIPHSISNRAPSTTQPSHLVLLGGISEC